MVSLLYIIGIIIAINWVMSYIDSMKEECSEQLKQAKRELAVSKAKAIALAIAVNK